MEHVELIKQNCPEKRGEEKKGKERKGKERKGKDSYSTLTVISVAKMAVNT